MLTDFDVTLALLTALKADADTCTDGLASCAVLVADVDAALAGVSKADAVRLVEALGVVRRVKTREQAVQACRARVLAVPLAHDSIAY